MNGRRWDLGWIIGSAAIVPGVLLAVWVGAPSVVIDLGVTLLIGGPHLFSTYAVTYFDPQFRRRHALGLVAVTILVPGFVVYAAIARFQLLISVFIFWASVHVLQQNAYLADVYRKRGRRREPRWSRWVDYGMLMLSFYPAAAYRLVHHDFKVAGVQVLVPGFLLTPLTCWAVWTAFGAFTVVWIAKTWREWRGGSLNVPKTLLIAVTTVIAFSAPLAEKGHRMELAFQAVNAWHSFQYLGIVWLVQKLRRERGRLESPAMSWLVAPRRGWRLYAACAATSVALVAVMRVVQKLDPLHLPSDNQYYFMMVLSALLIHYALDMYLFGFSLLDRARRLQLPYTAPVADVAAA
jgi:hypothetical protein